jgi:hypothetical protein
LRRIVLDLAIRLIISGRNHGKEIFPRPTVGKVGAPVVVDHQAIKKKVTGLAVHVSAVGELHDQDA